MKDLENIEVRMAQIPAPHLRGGHATVLTPIGEIDLSRAPSLRAHLVAAQSQSSHLIVDLSEVPYMDSSGVATLIECMQTARRSGSSLVLCSLQSKVRSIFEIARLDVVFRIVDSAEKALEVI
jgi:anti-sigma B factor antagonist